MTDAPLFLPSQNQKLFQNNNIIVNIFWQGFQQFRLDKIEPSTERSGKVALAFLFFRKHESLTHFAWRDQGLFYRNKIRKELSALFQSASPIWTSSFLHMSFVRNACTARGVELMHRKRDCLSQGITLHSALWVYYAWLYWVWLGELVRTGMAIEHCFYNKCIQLFDTFSFFESKVGR